MPPAPLSPPGWSDNEDRVTGGNNQVACRTYLGGSVRALRVCLSLLCH